MNHVHSTTLLGVYL